MLRERELPRARPPDELERDAELRERLEVLRDPALLRDVEPLRLVLLRRRRVVVAR